MARHLINSRNSIRSPFTILTAGAHQFYRPAEVIGISGVNCHSESYLAQEFGQSGTRWHGVKVA
jgi:hypothetical protein